MEPLITKTIPRTKTLRESGYISPDIKRERIGPILILPALSAAGYSGTSPPSKKV